jgi:hypothetical protein
MKYIVFSILIIFASFTVKAQEPAKFACYFTENLSGDHLCAELKALSFKDDADAKEILKTLLEPVGLRPNFVLQPCDSIQNCVATIGENGWRYILYDRVFLRNLVSEGGNHWASMSIFAHEVLHHLDQHTHIRNANMEKRRQMELEADAWSGRILAMLGATLEDAQAAVKSLNYTYDENFSTHPSKEQRLDAIATGYDAGMGGAKKPKGQVKLEDLSMQQHLYIKLDSLNETQNLSDSGWAIKEVIQLNNAWYGFFYKDQERKKNIIRSYSSAEELSADIKKNDFTIHHFQYANGKFVALVDTLKKINHQSLGRYSKLDANELNVKKAMGKVVKDVVFANGEYWVLEQDAEKSGINDQIVLITDAYPKAEISQLWKTLYVANTCKYVNRQWVTVMQKYKKDQVARVQVQGNKNTFPLDEFIRFEKDGFELETASFDGIYWGYTMLKFKNFTYENIRQ